MLRISADAERYACESSGRCCRGWPVDADRATAQALGALLEGVDGYRGREVLREGDPSSTLHYKTLAFVDGHCVFLKEDRRCDLHGRFGPSSKPLICRQYPHLGLRTPRGLEVTLAYSCPSAAKRILDPGPFRVHSRQAGPELAYVKEVPGNYPLEVRPGAPLSWEGHFALLDGILSLLAAEPGDPTRTLAYLRMALEACPGGDAGAVRDALNRPPPPLPAPPREETARLASELLAGVCARRRAARPWEEDAAKLALLEGAAAGGWPGVGAAWASAPPEAWAAYRRYLSAKAFGNLLFCTYGTRAALQVLLLLGFLVRLETARRGQVTAGAVAAAVEAVERLFPHESGIFDFWARKGEALESLVPEASAALLLAGTPHFA